MWYNCYAVSKGRSHYFLFAHAHNSTRNDRLGTDQARNVRPLASDGRAAVDTQGRDRGRRRGARGAPATGAPPDPSSATMATDVGGQATKNAVASEIGDGKRPVWPALLRRGHQREPGRDLGVHSTALYLSLSIEVARSCAPMLFT